jgi:DNA-binding beta-propeller fold protein YncE
VFATIRRGGVVGLDPATLEPRWGWPEPGSDAGAVAVSPLGDRVYLAVEGDDALDLPRTVQTRDALTGRVLAESVPPEHVRELAAAADGTLFGRGERRVFALRPGPGGLTVRWDVPVAASGLPRADGVRVSPDGARVAVLARGKGGGVRVLDARTGAVVGRTDEAPLDAAYGVEGRLWILNAREVRVVR